MNINQETISKIHTLLDAGLVKGMGHPVPGKMCVEAAICYALGLPHSDVPKCVLLALRSLKIRLNDQNWSSNKARAEGLRRLAIAQLGSDSLDEIDFCKRLARMTIQKVIPAVFREIAPILTGEHRQKLLALAAKCEAEPTEAHAKEAYAAAANAYAAVAAVAYSDPAAAAAANAINAASAASAFTHIAAANAASAAAAARAAAASAASASAFAHIAAAAADDAASRAAYVDANATNAATRAATAAAYAAKVAAYAATNATNAAFANAAAYAANTYAANTYAAANAAHDRVLAEYAESVVQILIEMNAPGVKWL